MMLDIYFQGLQNHVGSASYCRLSSKCREVYVLQAVPLTLSGAMHEWTPCLCCPSEVRGSTMHQRMPRLYHGGEGAFTISEDASPLLPV